MSLMFPSCFSAIRSLVSFTLAWEPVAGFTSKYFKYQSLKITEVLRPCRLPRLHHFRCCLTLRFPPCCVGHQNAPDKTSQFPELARLVWECFTVNRLIFLMFDNLCFKELVKVLVNACVLFYRYLTHESLLCWKRIYRCCKLLAI